MTDARPPIPAPIKRQVRQECGFGCVLCGLPLYHYDHVVDYAVVRSHTAENLALLCATHHGEKTNGLLPAAAVRSARLQPINFAAGESPPYELRYSGQSYTAVIGSNLDTWTLMSPNDGGVPLIIDDTPIVMFRAEDERLLLTVQLYDADNHLRVQIVDNELVYCTDAWDIEFVGQRLTIRAALRDIFVRIRFAPPDRIEIDKARVWRNGVDVVVTPNQVVVANVCRLSGNETVNCPGGICVGLFPPIGAALAFRDPPRRPFAGDTESEERTIWLGDPATRGERVWLAPPPRLR